MKNTWTVYLRIFSLIGLITIVQSCGNPKVKEAEDKLTSFIEDYELKVIPLEEEYNEAAFKASVTGAEEDYKKLANLEIMLNKIYANAENFEILKQLKNGNFVEDSLLQRQLDVLYNKYLPQQISEDELVKIIMLENNIEQQFSTFRAVVDDITLSNNDIDSILANSTDQEELRKVWEASKKVGEKVAQDIVRLVKKRNKVAQQLGFNNYYEMRLITSDQDPDQIAEIYDELDILTRGPYTQLKGEIDDYLSNYFDIPKENLLPWHYQDQFFQKAPSIFPTQLGKYYKNADILAIANDYYKSIGLNIENVIANSDFEEKPGKSQLAYTVDIDRQGDVRILANIKQGLQSMETMLYESGFAVYFSNIDRSLPYSLRTPAHFFTSDAVAIFFSRFASNPMWMAEYLDISDEEAEKLQENSAKHLRMEKFVFSRWAQVMYRFERSLYESPEQDLNKLWWDLVESYQLISRPTLRDAPDWAAKTHIATMPCTYHNYMLGEMLASQLDDYITLHILQNGSNCEVNCINNPEVGKYLIENIFSKGNVMNWNKLIKQATGEELSADHFTTQYIKL